MCAACGNVYCAGGTRKLFYMYSIHNDCWSKPTPPLMLHNAGAFLCNDGSLLLIGGNSDDIEEYDVKEDTWKVVPYRLPHKLRCHFAFVIDLTE